MASAIRRANENDSHLRPANRVRKPRNGPVFGSPPRPCSVRVRRFALFVALVPAGNTYNASASFRFPVDLFPATIHVGGLPMLFSTIIIVTKEAAFSFPKRRNIAFSGRGAALHGHPVNLTGSESYRQPPRHPENLANCRTLSAFRGLQVATIGSTANLRPRITGLPPNTPGTTVILSKSSLSE